LESPFATGNVGLALVLVAFFCWRDSSDNPALLRGLSSLMNRRNFIRYALPVAGSVAFTARNSHASIPKMRITRIRCYRPPYLNPTVNQSNQIVTIETDAGITGIGEGGTRDSIEQCAGMLIGEDPTRIEHLWQYLYRGYFYPPGREKLHALGALDLALWDIKGKALGVPVYELLGGLTRDHVECYSTGFPRHGTIGETARACVQSGFRAFRMAVDSNQDGAFDAHAAVRETADQCREVREAIGKDKDWAIDFHTRLDMSDAVTLASLIEPLAPYFIEDPLRSENLSIYKDLRGRVRVPIAVGEQLGSRWDINELIEKHLIDYTRVTLPNAGGITEFMKIATLCETHSVGMIPHFTGPIALSALVHALGAFSGPVLMEIGGTGPATKPYLPLSCDFHAGRLWPNARPGLGVEFDAKSAGLIGEFTERYAPIPTFHRPDGSLTNW
jgi:L-alanine-DL-glutamate epimerase-like enolase superfamily enzyme